MGDAGDHAVPPVRVPVAGAALTVRWVEATATCSACAWAASMTGDRGDDVEAFLRARWREHAHELHRRTN
jgi:hypothetical protein